MNPWKRLLNRALSNTRWSRPSPPMTEPVLGYRMWNCWRHQLKFATLQSLVMVDTHWPFRKPLVRECPWANIWGASLAKGYHFPSDDESMAHAQGALCSQCGIHAYHSFQGLMEAGYLHESIGSPNMLSGKVALWGEVAVHERGYRAEFAYPVEFYEHPAHPFDPSTALALEENYGVPVKPWPRAIPAATLDRWGAPRKLVYWSAFTPSYLDPPVASPARRSSVGIDWSSINSSHIASVFKLPVPAVQSKAGQAACPHIQTCQYALASGEVIEMCMDCSQVWRNVASTAVRARNPESRTPTPDSLTPTPESRKEEPPCSSEPPKD